MTLATVLAGIIPAAVKQSIVSAYEKSAGTILGWTWPGYTGNGDRGPPGAWQIGKGSGNITSEAFLTFSAVYACVRIISEDISKLPINFYDVDAAGDRSLNRTYPTNALLRKPNPYQNRVQFIEAFVISYLLTGNTYVMKRYDGRGIVNRMDVLNPRAVTPYITPEGDIFYRIGAQNIAGIVEATIVPARDIIHHRLQISPIYPLLGVTPIYAAAASSTAGQAILSNSQNFFQNGGRPAGVLTAPGKISEVLAKRLKEDWDTNYGATRTGKTAVLGEGLEFKQVSMTYVDAQVIEQLRWSIEDVARVFRVPPFMIGDLSKSNFKTVESISRSYLNGCLSYHISAIQCSLDEAFEFNGTMETELDIDAILKAEIDVRYQAYGEALRTGWQCINDVRRSEGMAPIEKGNEPLVQAQMRPLSLIVDMESLDSGGGLPEDDGSGKKPKKPKKPEEEEPEEAGLDADRVRKLIEKQIEERGDES
jgi:HK97 family phage portal protein